MSMIFAREKIRNLCGETIYGELEVKSSPAFEKNTLRHPLRRGTFGLPGCADKYPPSEGVDPTCLSSGTGEDHGVLF